MRKRLFAFALGLSALTSASAQNGVDHTREQVSRRAQDQIATVAAAIATYRDFALAKRRGWKRFGDEDAPLMGEHWYLPADKGGVDYAHGDRFDRRRPSNLMYTDIGGRRVLTGVTFNMRLGPGEPLPAGFDGPDDKWHVHARGRRRMCAKVWRAAIRRGSTRRESMAGRCSTGRGAAR